uniref:Uncharacterized protein n=1 Tax=Toxoplasma gondii (strain ATCC 50861 / VEG) TaxID=432359 RepID=A0A0F7V1F7_TOXGV|nr:TPA: hypothetical protein BN1205_077840 [Toxoplasma gondii VEG]
MKNGRELRISEPSSAPAEVAKYMQLFQEQKAAKDRQMLERKATLTRIRKDIEDLRSRMCSILDKAPKLRPLVDVRNCRWRYTKPGNIPDVGVSAAVSTTRTGSGILAETREEIQDLIAHQRRVIKNYIALTGRRRKRLRKMIQHKEGLLQEQSASASEKPDEGMKNQAAELQAAESDQRRMEADVSNAEELLRSAREVLKTYRQKLREMKRRPQRRRNPLRSVKRSPLITGPSVTAEAQSTSDTDVSDAGEGGSNAGSTGITGNVRGDVRTAPQRGASEGRLASDTSAATPTPREPRPSQSGRRKRKGQGERDVPLTGILLKGNGTRCHSGRAPVDGLGFSGVKSSSERPRKSCKERLAAGLRVSTQDSPRREQAGCDTGVSDTPPKSKRPRKESTAKATPSFPVPLAQSVASSTQSHDDDCRSADISSKGKRARRKSTSKSSTSHVPGESIGSAGSSVPSHGDGRQSHTTSKGKKPRKESTAKATPSFPVPLAQSVASSTQSHDDDCRSADISPKGKRARRKSTSKSSTSHVPGESIGSAGSSVPSHGDGRQSHTTSKGKKPRKESTAKATPSFPVPLAQSVASSTQSHDDDCRSADVSSKGKRARRKSTSKSFTSHVPGESIGSAGSSVPSHGDGRQSHTTSKGKKPRKESTAKATPSFPVPLAQSVASSTQSHDDDCRSADISSKGKRARRKSTSKSSTSHVPGESIGSAGSSVPSHGDDRNSHISSKGEKHGKTSTATTTGAIYRGRMPGPGQSVGADQMQAVPSHCGVSQSNVMEGCLPKALPGPDRAPHAEGTRGTQRPALPLTTSSTDPQLAAPPSPERPPVAFVELRRPPWPLFPPADVLYRDRVRKTLLPAPGSSQKETESGQGLLELSLGTVPHVGAPAVHGSDSRWWHQLEAMELAVVARRQADEKREANEERRVRERKQAEERKEAEAKRQLGISSALLPLRAQVHAFPEERTTGGDDETASSSVPSLGTTGSAIPHTQDPCEGMMGEGQGEASASADSQGAAGGFADAQTPSRGEGESVWMSGRLGGVDEGSGSGRPPAHQLPHALSVYSGRDMVGVDDQTTSPGDEDMSPLSSGAVDDAVIQEVLLWLEGATGEDDGAAQTSDDTHTAVTNLSMLPTHSFGAGEEEGASTTMSRESQRRSSDFSSETSIDRHRIGKFLSSLEGAGNPKRDQRWGT